jgi:enamine deaminase RidA (YjgF/YER057c/UK114 family)
MGKRKPPLQPSSSYRQCDQNLRARSVSHTFRPATLQPTDIQTGGWNPDPDISSPATWISPDIDAETDQAFANVELALKTAGGKGWSQVYSVRSYHVPLDKASTSAMVRNFKQWCGPEHRPIWTHMGVTGLGLDTMRVEIEVEALVE